MGSNSKANPTRRKAVSAAVRDHGAPPAAQPMKIGEAARALGVEPYVLRFWETQFPFLRPRHSPSKHRSYEARDLETLRLIKHLLHIEGYTIAGAKKHIRESGLDRLRAENAAKPHPKAAAPTPQAAEPAVHGDHPHGLPRTVQRTLS